MTYNDTLNRTSQVSSSQVLTHQLIHHVKVLSEQLRSQQEILRQQGMNLSDTAQSNMLALNRAVEKFSTQIVAAQAELRHLHALADITALINSIHEPDEVLAQVMDTVIQLSGAERGFIMLKNRDTGELEFKIARGIDREQLEQDQFTVSMTIINQVVETGEPALTDNASNDPRYQGQQSIVGFALRSIIAIPLKVRDELIGVVYCDNRIFAGMFKEEDLRYGTDFANQAAVAIENARLIDTARARLEEIRETSDLLQNVLGSIVNGVIAVDEDGIIHTCNPAAAAILGKHVDEIEGYPLLEAMPEVLGTEFQELLEHVRQTGKQEFIQADVTFEGRGQRHLNMVINPLRDADGTTQGVTIVLDDLTELREREEQFAQARRYLPAALANNLRVIDVAGVVGEERLITAISTDVRGFTTFSEHLEPEQLMEIINKYLSLASDAISFYKGVVDKFMGDAVTGLFNTQLNPQEDHAVLAVRAALGLMSDLHAIHEVLPPEQRLFYGAGIHTGLAVLGNVGSPERKEFAAIGDATELSKILEGNARGGEVVISEATYELVQEFFDCEAFVPEKTKGRDDLTVAYRVLRQKKPSGPISLDDFDF